MTLYVEVHRDAWALLKRRHDLWQRLAFSSSIEFFVFDCLFNGEAYAYTRKCRINSVWSPTWETAWRRC